MTVQSGSWYWIYVNRSMENMELVDCSNVSVFRACSTGEGLLFVREGAQCAGAQDPEN